ncbi:C-type lectin galactose-binding isoform [Labeo rohita]|uniref:C-type lectin galactose-binding isoform n=1 Tax=Labeo rohita TaxID=84645 RepID=A0ABQ8MRX6_LABRO|nr:C-type lectin galactose-binding isoform [Labeo rohita]
MIKDPKLWLKAAGGTYYPLCYKSFIHVSPGEMSWEEALDYCRSIASTSGLLRIESKDDQIETERELKRKKISGPVWVGLRQSRLFGFWIWYNRLHLGPWTNWKDGSAPEHQISEHCGALEKVNDLPLLPSSVIHISFFNHPHLSLSLNSEMNEVRHNETRRNGSNCSAQRYPFGRIFNTRSGNTGSNSPVDSETKSGTFIKTSPKCVTDDMPSAFHTLSRCVRTRGEKPLGAL